MIQISGVGTIDQTTDLWGLFLKDVRGHFGLYAGQLAAEIHKSCPARLPELEAITRRALTSDDPTERDHALHWAYQLPPFDLGEQLVAITERHEEWVTTGRSVSGTTLLNLFLDVLAKQPRSEPRALRALAMLSSTAAARACPDAVARAQVALDPQGAIGLLLEAVERNDAAEIEALLPAILVGAPSWEGELFARLSALREDRRRDVAAVAFRGLGADRLEAGYDRWYKLAVAINAAPQPLPPKPAPEVTAASDRFDRFLASYGQEPTEPPPLAGPIVLSTEVWLDLLRIPEGPTAELVALLGERRDAPVLLSQGILDKLMSALRQLGWSEAALRSAEVQARRLYQMVDVEASDAEELARAIGIGQVFTVGPRSSTESKGIALRPVHELITQLRRAASR